MPDSTTISPRAGTGPSEFGLRARCDLKQFLCPDAPFTASWCLALPQWTAA
jgi:hypothetical protein